MEQVGDRLQIIGLAVVRAVEQEPSRCAAHYAPDAERLQQCDGEAGHTDDHGIGRMQFWPNIAPGDMRRTIDRVTYLLPELTEEGRAALLLVAEAAPKRALDRAALDEQQRAREGDEWPAVVVIGGHPICTTCVKDRTSEPHVCEEPDLLAEHLGAECERMNLRAKVDAAAVRLGLVQLHPGSEAFKAREELFAAMGEMFGDDEIGLPKDRGHDGIGVGPTVEQVAADVSKLGRVEPWEHVVTCDGWKADQKAQGLVECTGCAPARDFDTENTGDRGPRDALVQANHEHARRLSRSYSASREDLVHDGCAIMPKGGAQIVIWPDGATYHRPAEDARSHAERRAGGR